MTYYYYYSLLLTATTTMTTTHCCLLLLPQVTPVHASLEQSVDLCRRYRPAQALIDRYQLCLLCVTQHHGTVWRASRV